LPFYEKSVYLLNIRLLLDQKSISCKSNF